MHIFLMISLTLASFKWANWKDWERYYPTMLYMALSVFLYEYISHEYFHLWELEESYFIKENAVCHILHSVFIYPLATFLFLSNYPNGDSFKKGIYILKWVAAFIIIEWILMGFIHVISYHNGWSLGWSLFFDIVMFPMLRLHYTNPKLALPLSAFWVFFYLIMFDYI